MAGNGVKLAANFEKLNELRAALLNVFEKKEMSALLKSALDKAIVPAYTRLRAIVPRGPTGNLAETVETKTKAYPKDGNAVGLVGYDKSAKAPWWLEYGTKDRPIKTFSNKPYQRRSKLGNLHTVRGQNAYIASSYVKAGQFRILSASGGTLSTDPAYQKAFFRKSSSPLPKGGSNKMPVGGSFGRPLLQTAFNDTQNDVASILEQQLTYLLDAAVQKLPVEKSGTL